MERTILGITLRDRKNAKLIRTQIRLEDSSNSNKKRGKSRNGPDEHVKWKMSDE